MSVRNSLDDIVSIDISIASPASSAESFSGILHISSQPGGVVTETLPSVIVITAAKDLLEFGFTEEHETYIASAVAFNQNPSPAELFIAPRVRQEGQYENINDTLNRSADYDGWYGITLDAEFQAVPEDVENVQKWAETNNKLFGYTVMDYDTLAVSNLYYRSFALYAGNVPDVDEQPRENSYAALALMAKCFGYEPGSETWAEKQLNSISPGRLNATQKKSLDSKQVTYFTTYAGKNITSAHGGKVLANEWIDVIRFRDWLRNDMQLKVFNLKIANPKLAYTNAGITAVQGKMEEALKDGQRAGGIAETEYDSDGNEVPGYKTSVPNAMDISDTQKASRILPDCKFSARIAGAIQVTKITGQLTY